jgi:benzodiazapine receptor
VVIRLAISRGADVAALILSVGVCLLAGVIGSYFTTPNIATWYDTLQKPFFTPPPWVFAPVWTTLYILMGISLWLVWREWKSTETGDARLAFKLFFMQLGLNVLWSLLFFGFRSPLAGMIGIILLWIAILATIVVFFRISRTAGLLLIPYIAWVTAASALTLGVLTLNP